MSTERIKRLQKTLGLSSDGVIGPATLSALENVVLGNKSATSKATKLYSLTLSTEGFNALITHEISSRAYYNKRLQKPVWPGGASGVTIGVGYDLGYNRDYQIRRDWQPYVNDKQLKQLESVSGIKGNDAKRALKKVGGIRISYEAAAEVFSKSTLPRYAKSALKTYEGLDKLFPDAQAAILSLVYNRGTRLSGSRRREMKAIQPLVAKQDYQGITEQLLAMKGLWQDTNLLGLLKRREDEAKLVAKARSKYDWKALVRV